MSIPGAASCHRRSALRRIAALCGFGSLSTSFLASPAPLSAQVAVGGRRAETDSEHIVRVSNEWFAALGRGDLETIDRLETDDFLTIQEAPGVGVAVIEKATQLRSLRTGKTPPMLRRELRNPRVRRYGDAAILTAVAIFTRQDSATGSQQQAVIAEVWVNQAEVWRISHFQINTVHATSKPK